MTIQRSVEEINQIFPDVKEAQIVYDLDTAQKDFCFETEYLQDVASLSDPTGGIAWDLPSDYRAFKKLLFYDVNGNPLYLKDYYIKYEIDNGVLYFRSVGEDVITTLPADFTTVYLMYYKRPSTLTSVGDAFSVLDEHILGVQAKIFETYFARYPVPTLNYRTGEVVKLRDLASVKYWNAKAKEIEIKAKRYIIGKEKTDDNQVINYGMAGAFVLPKRIDATMAGTITKPTLLALIYSKYILFKSVAGVITKEDSTGWTTDPTAVFVGNVLTITSADSEITNTMKFDSNNEDKNITSWASNSAVIEFGDASGTLSFWLFEREGI
jgi:hypothetical protein